MKERIIITGNVPKNFYVNSDDIIAIREKVPETFEDLKELCKDLKDVDIEEADEMDVARIIIHNADLIYFEDEILMIAGFKKLEIKPEQMWTIIKSLVGDM